MENTSKNLPIKVFRCGGVKAAVWVGTMKRDGKDEDVRRIRIQKSYKDKDTGEWKNTDWLYLDDLPKVAAVVTEVYRHFRVSSQEPNAETNENNDSRLHSQPTNNADGYDRNADSSSLSCSDSLGSDEE